MHGRSSRVFVSPLVADECVGGPAPARRSNNLNLLAPRQKALISRRGKPSGKGGLSIAIDAAMNRFLESTIKNQSRSVDSQSYIRSIVSDPAPRIMHRRRRRRRRLESRCWWYPSPTVGRSVPTLIDKPHAHHTHQTRAHVQTTRSRSRRRRLGRCRRCRRRRRHGAKGCCSCFVALQRDEEAAAPT